jgi:hypothetical protein
MDGKVEGVKTFKEENDGFPSLPRRAVGSRVETWDPPGGARWRNENLYRQND